MEDSCARRIGLLEEDVTFLLLLWPERLSGTRGSYQQCSGSRCQGSRSTWMPLSLGMSHASGLLSGKPGERYLQIEIRAL